MSVLLAVATACSSGRAAATAPVVTGVSVVRESPSTLRLFVSAYDPDGDMAEVAIAALDSIGPPAGIESDTVVHLGPSVLGETTIAGIPIAVAWLTGDLVGVVVRDTAGLSSKQELRWVPGYGGEASPTIGFAGAYRTGPDSLTLLASGADGGAAPNTVAFIVDLLTGGGALVAHRYVEAPGTHNLTAWNTRVALTSLGASRQGHVSALDANGNVSGSLPFKFPEYGAGGGPSVTEVSVTRPRSFRLAVSFAGSDPDGDQAVGLVEYMDGPNGSGVVLARYEIIFLKSSTGAHEFSGFSEVDGLSAARSVRVTVRDAAGNSSGARVAEAPPSFVPGDANGDGFVTVLDASLACRIVSKVMGPGPLVAARADVYPEATSGGDGLDLNDVRSLLRIAAGLWSGPPRPQ